VLCERRLPVGGRLGTAPQHPRVATLH